MTLTKLAAAAVALAALSGLARAESFSAFSEPAFTTETMSLVGEYLTPSLAGETVESYSVLSTTSGFNTSATVNFATKVTSFSFLWGSPDSYNMVSDGTETVTGSMISSGETVLYTFADMAGFSSLTFSTTGIAFELAQVSPVPEPATFAMALAGIAAIGLFSLRRKRD